MRKFEESDRKKKNDRIRIRENTAGLSPETIETLEKTVKAALKEGYLPCGIAFKIAREAGVPQVAVGETADRLGVRITNCQLGCFKVDKTVYDNSTEKKADSRIIDRLDALQEKGDLTCAGVFELACQLKLTPMAVADVANLRNMKIHRCQLGCF
jgi:hypothetical protein